MTDIVDRLEAHGVVNARWGKRAGVYFSHSSGKVALSNLEKFFDESVRLAEESAHEIRRLRAALCAAGVEQELV